MLRSLPLFALLIALAPGLASAGSEDGGPQGWEIDFVAVVDVLGLDVELVEDLGLQDWDGPVVLATTANAELTDFYIRYDAVPGDLGPLAVFDALSWLDPAWTSAGLPVVLTDAVDPAAVHALLVKDAPVAAVVETAFLSPELLGSMPVEVMRADAVISVFGGEPSEAPLVGAKLQLVDPAAVGAGLVDAVTPVPTSDPSVGLLCLGPMTSDFVCIVADSPVPEQSEHWVLWTDGGLPMPEKEVEEEADDSGSEAPEATDDSGSEAPAEDDSGSAPVEEEPTDDSGSAPVEPPATNGGSAPPDLSELDVASSRAAGK